MLVSIYHNILAWFLSCLIMKMVLLLMHCNKCMYYVKYQHVSRGRTMPSKLSAVKFSMLENIANEL